MSWNKGRSTPRSQSSPHQNIVTKIAFSLIEVAFALGIISFAVVGILGMLPLALKSGQESMRDTDSTLIAQRIFTELKTGAGAHQKVSTSSTGSSIIDLTATSSNNFIAFKDDGSPLAFCSTNTPNAAYDFYARVSISTNTGVSNLSQITIDVLAPAAAPSTAQTTNSFTTLIGF